MIDTFECAHCEASVTRERKPHASPAKYCSDLCRGRAKRIRNFSQKQKSLKEYYQKNRERILAQDAARRAADPEKERARCAAYRKANPEVERARKQSWNEANPEKRKALDAKWRANNPEKVRAASAAWKIKNPDKARAYSLARYARTRGAVGSENFTLDEIYSRDDQMCYLCDKPVDRTEATMDHVIHVSKGGPHTRANVLLADRSCNCSKGDKDLDEYLGWLAYMRARGLKP